VEDYLDDLLDLNNSCLADDDALDDEGEDGLDDYSEL